MKDAPKLMKIPKSECPDTWIRQPRHKWPTKMVQKRRSSRSLRAKSVRSSLAELLWERQFEKILLQYGWEKVSNRECFFVHREKGLFLSVFVDDIKLGGKKQY